jgi:hypothetical protein
MITGLFTYFIFILSPIIMINILHKLYNKDRSYTTFSEAIERESGHKIRHVADLRELSEYCMVSTDLIKGDMVYVESSQKVYIYNKGLFRECVNRFSKEYTADRNTFKPKKYLLSELGIFVDI